MTLHLVVRLPDGRQACADYREPVAAPMRRIHRAVSEGRRPDPALFEVVSAWLDGHREQSAVCYAGLSPAALPCGHGEPP